MAIISVVKKSAQTRMIVFFIIVIAAVIGIYLFTRTRTITGYQDQYGNVYQCSKRLKAKQGNAVGLGHDQGPVPVDEQEAQKVCSRVGVE